MHGNVKVRYVGIAALIKEDIVWFNISCRLNEVSKAVQKAKTNSPMHYVIIV